MPARQMIADIGRRQPQLSMQDFHSIKD